MPFDDQVARRIHEIMAEEAMEQEALKITEKRMFGGLAIMVNGHMCFGIEDRNLVVRVGRDEYEKSLTQPHARPMDFTGRAMRGFVYVEPAGYRSKAQLRAWIRRSLRFVLSLPPK